MSCHLLPLHFSRTKSHTRREPGPDYTPSIVTTLPADMGYKFVASGDVTGNFGGSYGGVLQALPVPEPETHAMLLAGLCLMGAILRRCKIAA